MKYLYITILICSFSFSDYLGGYPGAGFRYSTNAREMSLGNAIISEYNQGFNSFSNPALLSNIKKYEFGTSYFLMSLDRYIQVLSVARNLNNSAGASISIFRSGVNHIEGKDFSNQSSVIAGTYAKYLSEKDNSSGYLFSGDASKYDGDFDYCIVEF